jgi:copper oxidase (laccase) domain-containing protein
LITWDQPGYVVAFTTRVGGVSDGIYESLNLTARTGDDAARVEENRRRVCAEVELAYDRLSFNRQVHATTVNPAGARGEPGDGLWSDEPGQPMLAFSADCLPIAIARTDGERRLALVHAGWRGLRGGIVAAGVAVVGGETAAVVGPAIGPGCIQVGDEVW